ncbi:hypothetical protein ACLOJK_038339 [Asimina triloba]
MEGYDTTMVLLTVNPSSAIEEVPLPSPPLDEGAFLTTQPIGMELAQVEKAIDRLKKSAREETQSLVDTVT